MGPLILARALAGTGVPYAVKIHGSALEYTVKPYPRFLPAAREGLAGAGGVLVGSRHTGESLWAALDDPGLEARRASARPASTSPASRRAPPPTPPPAGSGCAPSSRRTAPRPLPATTSTIVLRPLGRRGGRRARGARRPAATGSCSSSAS